MLFNEIKRDAEKLELFAEIEAIASEMNEMNVKSAMQNKEQVQKRGRGCIQRLQPHGPSAREQLFGNMVIIFSTCKKARTFMKASHSQHHHSVVLEQLCGARAWSLLVFAASLA
jgi:hypothetical protein